MGSDEIYRQKRKTRFSDLTTAFFYDLNKIHKGPMLFENTQELYFMIFFILSQTKMGKSIVYFQYS